MQGLVMASSNADIKRIALRLNEFSMMILNLTGAAKRMLLYQTERIDYNVSIVLASHIFCGTVKPYNVHLFNGLYKVSLI